MHLNTVLAKPKEVSKGAMARKSMKYLNLSMRLP
jgi:hypothetical protein